MVFLLFSSPLDWGKLDIGFVHEATCGEEALALAGEVQPDLILTDIRMPHMDGLELIERLKEQWLATKVVIISGFSDFEYAKKALSLGASDYILKPVEDDDLLNVVARCLEQIETERQKEALLKKADAQVNKRLPLLKEMLFSKLIMGHKPDVGSTVAWRSETCSTFPPLTGRRSRCCSTAIWTRGGARRRRARSDRTNRGDTGFTIRKR